MRDVPQSTTKTFTFSNGVTVRYTPVSPFFITKLRALAERQIRDERPQPPIVTTDLGNVPNTAAPAYVAAMSAYQQKCGVMMLWRALVMALELDPDDRDASLAVAAELRAQNAEEGARYRAMLAEAGLEDAVFQMEEWATFPGAEHPICQYVIWVGCDGENMFDLMRLIQAIQGIEEQEAAVQTTAESFSGDVPGAVNLEIEPAG